MINLLRAALPAMSLCIIDAIIFAQEEPALSKEIREAIGRGKQYIPALLRRRPDTVIDSPTQTGNRVAHLAHRFALNVRGSYRGLGSRATVFPSIRRQPR